MASWVQLWPLEKPNHVAVCLNGRFRRPDEIVYKRLPNRIYVEMKFHGMPAMTIESAVTFMLGAEPVDVVNGLPWSVYGGETLEISTSWQWD